ncbi:MAG: sugar O-acetyltransferase [Treponema sp.]|jgi:galactoside O-acetyltransferase|nr:sugar O-acetyltransferase [Treponema sp.]
MIEREHISAGRLFANTSKDLPEERYRGRELMTDYNMTRPSEIEKRINLAKKMFKKIGERFLIEPPVYFAYGSRISIGEEFRACCNLTVIDDWKVDIGNGVLIGPNVTISTTVHPTDPGKRRAGYIYGFKVVIEDDVWIESGVLINPGVTIGRGSVIGAGSVVTGDIPPYVLAAGNPCKILRPIGPDDAACYCREWHLPNPDNFH